MTTIDDQGNCRKCGSDDTEWEQCWCCMGEGAFDVYDEHGDYGPGECLGECAECRGAGGYVFCHECARQRKVEA